MNTHQATDEDSICADLLAVGAWALKVWLLWNALVSIVVAIFSMKLEPLLLALAFSIPLDPTLPSARQLLHTVTQLPELYRTLSILLSRNSGMLSQNLSAASDVSTVLVNRGSRWSSDRGGAGDGSGPLFITFKNEWEMRDDPPFEWYALQPHTRFKSVDHRRSRESPFFHEFLILKLGDGSFCRLERTGEGSRLNAISRIGSLAHDIIERITSDGYERKLDETSDMISRIEFPEEFDLLDVLAICYAIQKHKHSSKYTLQRYNCYFFCCTILVVLTRRLLSWEKTFTDKTWGSTLDTALSELSSRLQKPLSEYSHRYIMPRLCTIFGSGTQFLLNAMRAEMGESVWAGLNEACAQTLWGSRLDNAIDKVLEAGLSGMVEHATNGTCPRPIQLTFQLDYRADAWNQPTCALALTIYSRKMIRVILDHLGEVRAGLSETRKFMVDECVGSWTEYYSRSCWSLWQFLGESWGTLLEAIEEMGDSGEATSTLMWKFNLAKQCFTRGLWLFLTMDVRAFLAAGLDIENIPLICSSGSILREIYLTIKATYQGFLLKIEIFRIILAMGSLAHLMKSYDFRIGAMEKYLLGLRGTKGLERLLTDLPRSAGEDALVQTLNAIQNTDLLGPVEWRAVIALGSLWEDDIFQSLDRWWWKFCGGSLSQPTLDAIHSGQSQKIILSRIFDSSNCETLGEIPYVSMSVLEYQQRIKSRIAVHANRVASTQLGAAELVRQDIEDAMAGVWASLPKGYGPRIGGGNKEDNEGNSAAGNSGSTNEDVVVDGEDRGDGDGEDSGDGSDVSGGSR